MFSSTAMEDADNRPSNITVGKIKPIFLVWVCFQGYTDIHERWPLISAPVWSFMRYVCLKKTQILRNNNYFC